MDPNRIYVYSVIRDDDDPSPNAVLKTDVTDLIKNQGYKLLDRHRLWAPEEKRPVLNAEDWRRIKVGFVRAAKLVLPKEDWPALEKFEPQQSTRYVVTDFSSWYPSTVYETIYKGGSRKIVLFPEHAENRSQNEIDAMYNCMPGIPENVVIPNITFERCDRQLWDQFKHDELDFLLKLKDL